MRPAITFLNIQLSNSRIPPFIFRIDQTTTCSDSTCIRTSDTYILSKITYFCKCFTSGQTGKTILEKRRL